MAGGHEELAVALQKADGAALFLPAAPAQKAPVQFVLVAGQGHPEVEDIPQENQVIVVPGQRVQQTEKCGRVAPGLADMGVGDEDQGVFSSESRLSSFSIHITLMIPTAQAGRTPWIHAKNPMYSVSLSFHWLPFSLFYPAA